jgi:hypothetical protein
MHRNAACLNDGALDMIRSGGRTGDNPQSRSCRHHSVGDAYLHRSVEQRIGRDESRGQSFRLRDYVLDGGESIENLRR